MKVQEVFDLKRTAKRAGGDRYESEDGTFIIYIPQRISRPEGEPLQTLKITFES